MMESMRRARWQKEGMEMSDPLIIHVTGARPNFPKAAPVIRALSKLKVKQLLVHTGQHYDDAMSKVFFEELNLPQPDINLGVGSGSHAEQTGAVMVGIEKLLMEKQPALVMVYGDINSTVATAIVCAKLHIPCAHVEAGLRSFDDRMPEEINRRLTDQISNLLFATSRDAIDHLKREGVAAEKIHFVGNPMIDTLLASLSKLDTDAVRAKYSLPERYAVVTMHRPSNVDDPQVLSEVVALLNDLAGEVDLLFPIHPRGRERFLAAGLSEKIHITAPLPYTEFMSAVKGAAYVLTDSGGVQEETTVLGVPCLTLRENTERPVTITDGTNQLVSFENARQAAAAALKQTIKSERTPELWDGRAGERIAEVVDRWLRDE